MRFALFSVFFLGLGGCEKQAAPLRPATSAQSTSEVQAAPVRASSAAPTLAPPPADGSTQRLSAKVHLPGHLAPDERVPLLLLLHSLGTSAEDIESRTDWARFADKRGLAWIAPNGPTDALGRRFWDAGPSCCNFMGPPVDHVAALRALLEEFEFGPIAESVAALQAA